MTNFFRSHGNATKINFLRTQYAVPLGVMLFRFKALLTNQYFVNLLNFVHLEKPSGVRSLMTMRGKLLRRNCPNRIRQSGKVGDGRTEKKRDGREEKKRKEIVAQKEEARQKESQNNTFQKPTKPSTTIMSVRSIATRSFRTFLPREVRHIVKTAPIYSYTTNTFPRTVSAQDIKRVLNKAYNWSPGPTREGGIFIIFNSLGGVQTMFLEEWA